MKLIVALNNMFHPFSKVDGYKHISRIFTECLAKIIIFIQYNIFPVCNKFYASYINVSSFKLPFIICSFQPYTAHIINMIQRILHDIRQ